MNNHTRQKYKKAYAGRAIAAMVTGGALSLTGIYRFFTGLPASQDSILINAAMMSAGLYIGNKLGHDFFQAASHDNPPQELRRLAGTIKGAHIFQAFVLPAAFAIMASKVSERMEVEAKSRPETEMVSPAQGAPRRVTPS